MDLFVKKTDTTTVKFVVATTEDKQLLVAASQEEACKQATEKGNKVAKTDAHSVTYKFPSYKDNSEIIDASFGLIDGQLTFKPSSLRRNRMHTLLLAWTLTASGKPTPQEIDDLNPLLASYIGEEMDRVLGLM